jgi:hypothetical protein
VVGGFFFLDSFWERSVENAVLALKIRGDSCVWVRSVEVEMAEPFDSVVGRWVVGVVS